MVDQRGKARDKYLASGRDATAGAPPLPPPGGYRRVVRTAPRPFTPAAPAPATSTAQKSGRDAFGMGALIAAAAFAAILLIMVAADASSAIYSVTMLTVQLILLAVVVAALVTRRGRALGAAALSITLVFNVATVGALGAIRTSAAGSYADGKSDAEKHDEAYPGVPELTPEEILSQDSLEESRDIAEAFLQDVRDTLSAEFDLTWSEISPETLRNERNGRGGESMLVRYTAPTWATNEAIQDNRLKERILEVISDVAVEHGLSPLVSVNDPSNGYPDDMLEKFYGSADIETQYTWEWYSDNWPGPLVFYATINDTSKDTVGDFTESREKQSERTGEPVEGLQLTMFAPNVLSEDDRAEFEELIQEY